MVPQVYAAIMLGTLVLFWLFSYSDPAHLVPSNVKFTDQLKALKDPKGCSSTASTTASCSVAMWPVAVDGAVLRGRVWSGHPRGRLAGCLLLVARRRAAALAACCRQVRRPQRDLVGDVGELDLPVPAELPTDRFHHRHRQRPQDLPHRPERVRVHRHHVPAGHLLGVWQGQRVQVHQRRLPQNIGTISGIVGLAGGMGGSCCPSCSVR